jgi:hypothetical protein
MRQELYHLAREVRENNENIPNAVQHLLPTNEELD